MSAKPTFHYTGHLIVDAITRFNVFVNALVIPRLWFQHITIPRRKGKRDRDARQPDLNAIILLADIVFWYTAKAIYDEETGQIVGVRKRFKADKLQRSLDAFGKQYGLSKAQVYDAKVRLEDLGLIRTEERTVTLPDGRHLPCQLFWEPVPDAIERITFEKSTMLSVDNIDNPVNPDKSIALSVDNTPRSSPRSSNPPLREDPALVPKKPKPRTRLPRTPMPTDPTEQAALKAMVLTEEMRAWAAREGLTVNWEGQWDAFVDKAVANGYRYLDWRAAFRNWLRSPYQLEALRHPNGHVTSDHEGHTIGVYKSGAVCYNCRPEVGLPIETRDIPRSYYERRRARGIGGTG